MDKIKKADQKLPFVVCDCGFKLIVIPDLDEMARSIEAHATTHSNDEFEPEKAEAEYCRIEELLSNKVLIEIAKRNSNQFK